MSYARRRFPTKLSQREIRNHLAGLDALHNGAAPVFEAAKVRKPQGAPEREVMGAIKDWARARGDLTLFRNNVGSFEWKPGRWMRFGLATGSSDFIGLQSVIVTKEMVGKRIAQFVAIEAKAESGGVVSDEQKAFIEAIKKAGGKAGVARNAVDAEAIVEGWHE